MSDPIRLDDTNRIETAFAVLHRSETLVFKRRKPVRLRLGRERLDLTSPAQRRAACRAEWEMNRLLCPDTVREVVPLRREDDGCLVLGDEESAIDWALCLRRLPDAHRAATRLEHGSLDEATLSRIAEHVATFHEKTRGESATAHERGLAALRDRIDLVISNEAFSASRPLPETAAHAREWQHAALVELEARLLARSTTDSIRDGHGELTLEHVFVDDEGRVRILSGLEVAPTFRNADVTADVALLAADLAARHRVDLAERFVAEYARLANDFDLYPLLDFYTSLWATLRGKIDWVGASVAPALGERYRARARSFFELAIAAPRRALLPPIVVAMGGQVASGKSTVALEIARRIGAPVVGADPTRDFLLGARLNEDLHEVRWADSYAPGFAERVYAEVLRRAGEVLHSGRPVVIDGCFRSTDQRLRARALADRMGLPFLFVEANVSRSVQTARLEERATRDDVPLSDWQSIADQLRSQWEPVSGLASEEYLALDTGQPLAQSVERIEARIPTWPEGLTG